jgi:hypothetical protein
MEVNLKSMPRLEHGSAKLGKDHPKEDRAGLDHLTYLPHVASWVVVEPVSLK